MKIGVLSDTHGEVQRVEQARCLLEKRHVSLLIHCGDVGFEILPLLKGLRTHFVQGNMDAPNQLREAITAPEHTYHGEFGALEIEGRSVAFLHGHDVKLLRDTIHSGQWDLVCCGHSHVYSCHFEGRTLVLNPGALARTSHPSLALVEMPSLEVTQVSLWPTMS
jgi:uncharacterized protein